MERVEIVEIDEARSVEANPRAGVDAETVERYAATIDELPPATLYRVGEALLVADGLHRFAAARQAGRDTIDAEIIDGTEHEWLEAVLLSNHQHGRPWTRGERRECVARWLRLYPERSDNWIAEDMQVSKNTVAVVREELEATCQIDRLTELVGKDGRTRPRRLEPLLKYAWVMATADRDRAEADDEYQALKADIARHGVLVPIEYAEGNVLDGHRRLRACKDLGIEGWPSIIRGDLSEEDKLEHILALNLRRRHARAQDCDLS